MLYKWFERHFAFSRRELNGICTLSVVLLIFWLAPRVLDVGDDTGDGDLSASIADIERFLATAGKRQTPQGKAEYMARSPEARLAEVEYFMFDPNGLAAVEWKRLGLSERQVRMIKNYEAKGGRFRTKEDLKKIYAIGDADYARLEAYIDIEEEESMPPSRPTGQGRGSVAADNEERQALLLELNTADSVSLQFLPGIGPVFASRIVRFRELLGGFHDVSQLMDVYGFDSVRFEGLETHVYVDTGKVKKIPVNTATYERLRDHPFISHKLANAMVQYRKQHGAYQSLADLLNIAIVDETIFRKIAPYLTLGND